MSIRVNVSGGANASEYRVGSITTTFLTPKGVWDAAAYVVVTYASSIALNFSTFINAQITLTGNTTLAAPTNLKVGQSGVIRLVQDATGSRTVAYNTAWKFPGGTIPTASTAANAVDYLFFHVVSSTLIVANLVKDVK